MSSDDSLFASGKFNWPLSRTASTGCFISRWGRGAPTNSTE